MGELAEHDGPLLEFDYTNWRGHNHHYVVDVDKFEYGPYDNGGRRPDVGADLHWVLHAYIVTRDGDPRPDLQNRRRTFVLAAIRNLAETPRSK